jgi:Thiamine pyrophosphate-requiring enzymes [acetolactate synthase, pyruvate dehydrogenase (cytochrome), glyoxylate carboligase, phosphonopyruvate decarboxylase]
MKLSDYVVNFLIKNDIKHVFEVAGGSLAHLLDSLYGRNDFSSISMHHETAAAFAAEGYARVSGNIGVAMATSGPGATNLITGIGSTFFDSIPCLFITGQVNTYEFKFSKPVRQVGFQETDIVNIVKPIVKDALLIKNPDKIKYYLEKLIYTAKSGRPGPVLIDIPMDVQRAEIEPKNLLSFHKASSNKKVIGDKIIDDIINIIRKSIRPVILIGGGLRLSKAQDELFKFVKKTEMPVVTSLMGVDAFPHDDELFVGMIGSYGNRYANLTIANSDLVLALGTRLDTRQTGTKPETFARNATIIHIDIDLNELNSKVHADFPINCDLKLFLSLLNTHDIDFIDKNKIKSWKNQIEQYKKRYPSFEIPGNKGNVNPNYFFNKLSDHLPADAIICVDIGQNQMWAAQSLKIKKHQRFITQGGMGAMGSALPMAIGAAFAEPDKPIIVITGDGGFQLNIQELQTVYHHKLNIKIILLNNKGYGMVKQFQEQYFNSRLQSTVIGYSCPDFQEVVSAYKISSNKIIDNDEIDKKLKELFISKEAKFLEVNIMPDYKALPKLSVGRPVEDQEPLLSRDELKSNMLINMLNSNDEE